MKIDLRFVENNLYLSLLAVVLCSLFVTGCSSNKSAGKRTRLERNVRTNTPSAVGNFVALDHNGKTIYVDESAVEEHLARGDTFSVKKGKSFYGNEKALREFSK